VRADIYLDGEGVAAASPSPFFHFFSLIMLSSGKRKKIIPLKLDYNQYYNDYSFQYEIKISIFR
jgi:hypothetical protein